MSKQWEFMVVYSFGRDTETERMLNEHGRDGWDVAAVSRADDGDRIYMRREVRNEAPPDGT